MCGIYPVNRQTILDIYTHAPTLHLTRISLASQHTHFHVHSTFNTNDIVPNVRRTQKISCYCMCATTHELTSIQVVLTCLGLHLFSPLDMVHANNIFNN